MRRIDDVPFLVDDTDVFDCIGRHGGVCVREKESKREKRGGEQERERKSKRDSEEGDKERICVRGCVCTFVCVRGREKEKERVGEREIESG